jgi:(1->4)-alpha-D-glucan 1-alpha-D-glucosylmutase
MSAPSLESAASGSRLELLRQRLARLRGIGEAYYDHRGELRSVSVATRDAVLAAMGCTLNDELALEQEIEALESARWRTLVPPVAVLRPRVMGVALALPVDLLDKDVAWQVRLESSGAISGTAPANSLAEGERREIDGGTLSRRLLVLPDAVPIGYHELRVSVDARAPADCALIVAPECCFEPEGLRSGQRAWGLAAQLYTLRSQRNWGIGDFADLRELVEHAARCGADFVGINPLHALFVAHPGQASPYSPSSRQFLNILYISVPQVPEYAECQDLRREMESAGMQVQLTALRGTPLVDYPGVSGIKLPALERLYAHFRDRHLAMGTSRARAFREYRRAQGEALRRFALHEAIDRKMRDTDPAIWGWPAWPVTLRDPEHEAVIAFEAEHPDEIAFHEWLQWVASGQLAAAQARARELGMGIGLYGDYAVGVNVAGAETWANQRVYRIGAAVGAPPDALALKGQDWGIPPQDPHALAADKYRPFRALIEANMRHYGALRVDHVMSLFRQWWVPGGASAVEGGYVHYPLADLMSMLALESVRQRCLVIGEDLGTVPDEVRHAMAAFAVYHYKVLLFEKESDGRFRAPDRYERRSIAAASTHDLPTLRGYWEGGDLALRDRLQLYPDDATRQRVHAERALDRERLQAALVAVGLDPAPASGRRTPFGETPVAAVQCFLARSTAALVALQIEDLLGISEPVNVPGTLDEYPNWQRKLTLTLDEIFADEAVQALLRQIRELRPKFGSAPVVSD